MPTGHTSLYYPKIQPQPKSELKIDDSYFLVKLHNCQVFFQGDWWNQADLFTLTSSVESSFRTGSPIQSLLKSSAIKKDTPCKLGLNTNLTDWLPARVNANLKISLTYNVLKGKPIQNFIKYVEKADLVTKLTLGSGLESAIKTTTIVANLLSFLAQEGEQKDIFNLQNMNLDIGEMKTGYYVSLGSHTNEESIHPENLRINDFGNLESSDNLSRFSYAIIQILAIPRLQMESFREQQWWQLIDTVKNDIFQENPRNNKEREEIFTEWHLALKYATNLARRQPEFLWNEIKDILATAGAEVINRFPVIIQTESNTDDDLPFSLQTILEVETQSELRDLVNKYQDRLKISREILSQYK
jgi:hypothetical protein